MEHPTRTEGLENRKNRAIEALSVQFSRNSLPLEEYERLVEYIHRVESERELAIVEKVVNESTLYAAAETFKAAPITGKRKRRRRTISFLASRTSSGVSLRQSRCSFFTLLGNNIINIEEGDLPPGRTEIQVVSLLGLTIINVPAGVRVINEAIPIAGGIFVEGDTRTPSTGPELVITGGAYLGNITVRVGKGQPQPPYNMFR
ncbi:MAG: hypothetical protein LBU17_09605 [Treponema sp.]|jgi:hypothetical protein|nr:hypothetical protein [Treponema sp.]